MNKVIREDWKTYLIEEKDYTEQEIIEKAVEFLSFFIEHKMRVDSKMFLNPIEYSVQSHLSDLIKEKYILRFTKRGFAPKDAIIIVKCMDAIYHCFDLSFKEAEEVTSYAADNHLTITQAIKDKLNVDFNEVNEFLDTVYPLFIDGCIKRCLQYGYDIVKLINDLRIKED